MTTFRTVILPLVLFALPGSTRVEDAQEIAYRPSAPATVVRTLESSFELELESMSLSMNGEEIPAEHFGAVDMQITHGEKCVVTDVIEEMGEGRPRKLRRTFDELGGTERTTFSTEEGPESDDGEYESQLEGKSVVFSWSEEAQAFEAAFAEDSGGDAALLEGLEEDMDLRRLLPEAAVVEGARWEIDAREFHSILDPGGDLAMQGTDEEGEGSQEMDAQLRDNLSGTIRATFKGVEEEGAQRIAVIALEVEAETKAEETLGEDMVPEGGSGTGRVGTRFELEGELRWDLVHGHALSLELAGEQGLTMNQMVSADFDGESVEQSQTMEFTGTTRFSLQVERR